MLAWRVPRLDDEAVECGDVADDAFRIPWPPAPSRAMADGPVGRWGIQQGRLLAGRVRVLVEQVAVDPPRWAADIRPRSDPGAERDRWEADVGVVVAYRDQLRISDDAVRLALLGFVVTSSRPG